MKILEILLEYKTPADAVKTLLAIWRRQVRSTERDAATFMYQKILNNIRNEYGEQTASQMDKYVQSGQADRDDANLIPAQRDKSGNITTPAQKLTWPPVNFKPQERPSNSPKEPGKQPTKKPYYDKSAGIQPIVRILVQKNPDGDEIWGYAQFKNSKLMSPGDFITFDGKHKGQLYSDTGFTHNEVLHMAKSKMAERFYTVSEDNPEYKYILDMLNSKLY